MLAEKNEEGETLMQEKVVVLGQEARAEAEEVVDINREEMMLNAEKIEIEMHHSFAINVFKIVRAITFYVTRFNKW